METAATPDELRRWWSRWPEANVGVVTGWVSALVVLDVDPRHGGDRRLAQLERTRGPLPGTVTSRTGGGGRHLFFAHPTHLVASRPLAPGLDLKAQGGLVVIPPSRHASGRRYQWEPGRDPDTVPLRDPPTWLVARPEPPPGARRPMGGAAVARTPAEQQEFAGLWAEVGVEVSDREVMVRCPFHDDHRPSLHVDPVGCRWFCFGCRRGGGIGALRRLVAPDLTRRRSGPDLRVPEPPTLADGVTVGVVGESAHQEELLALVGGRRTWSGVHLPVLADLVPEHDNPRDPAAVEVVIEGHPVGHLPGELAAAYRPVVLRAIAERGRATCRAEIRGGWERPHGDVGRFGVVLRLPALEPGSGASPPAVP
jgi:hypothetical protein